MVLVYENSVDLQNQNVFVPDRYIVYRKGSCPRSSIDIQTFFPEFLPFLSSLDLRLYLVKIHLGGDTIDKNPS